jgi:uncharacterized protein (DUF58 family)
LAARKRYVPLVVRAWRFLIRDTTTRGRFLLALVFFSAILGADTRRSQTYVLFAIGAGSWVVAVAAALGRRPRVALACDFPERATAGSRVGVRVRVTGHGRSGPLLVHFPQFPYREAGVEVSPASVRVAVDSHRRIETLFEWQPARRGRFELPGPRIRRTDPFALVMGRGARSPGGAVYVYPRYFHIDDFDTPLGRRFQPGGVPLSSSTGDAVEFVGTREYRAGDPLRTIHWRSWARTGTPVVKEFQEEYFTRLALVLDTFVPRRRTPRQEIAFEAAISILASLADYFSRTEALVDIFAAGPDLYEVSAGRSLAYLENILDVLACLEPCPDAPFATLGPALSERLHQTTSVVAVLLDWDDARSKFLTHVRDMGVAVRTLIVREEETTLSWQAAAEEMSIELVPPDIVAKRLSDD